MSDVNERSPVQLTPQAKAELVGLEGKMKQAQHWIEVMKEMDMDVTAMQAELDHHEKIRKILLREFSD